MHSVSNIRVRHVLLLALCLGSTGGLVAWSFMPRANSSQLVAGCNVQSACTPKDCALPRGAAAGPLPNLSVVALAAEKDLHSRSHEYCSKLSYGCAYTLRTTDSGLIGEAFRHPFAGSGQACVYVTGGELIYLYAADGQYLRQLLAL